MPYRNDSQACDHMTVHENPMIRQATNDQPPFTRQDLGDGNSVSIGKVPDHLLLNDKEFETLWQMHPSEHNRILIHGRQTPIPRWHRAFGNDYRFSGQVATALDVPAILKPLLEWGRVAVDDRLNGILVNWYDGALGHYIGPHHDDQRQLVVGTSIVTVSFGEERLFRMLRARNDSAGETMSNCKHDFTATTGGVIVIPWSTNRVWKHCVPKSTRYRGRRISITLRAFRAVESARRPV